jgi:PleD family two-component response regulator
LVRSLKRTSRHLEKVLTELRRSSWPTLPEADSRVRRRVRCVLIVSESDRARRFFVEPLVAAGFFVEWASNAQEAHARAERCDPDVVVVEHSANDALSREVVTGLAAANAMQRTLIVGVDRSAVGTSSERCVTVVQLRESDQDIGDVIGAIGQAVSR